MSPDTIKSFLVGLGFGVDDASLSKFNRAIAQASLKVTALYASTKLAAAGIVAGIAKVSQGFEQMGYEYHIIAPAINKALVLRRELLRSYSLAGINIRKVVKDSINLNLSLTKTKFAFQAIYKSVASRFFELLTKQSDLFRAKIYANMPRIQRALETFVRVVFKAVEVTTLLGTRLWSILGRVYDLFLQLDSATNGWSTKILAAVAAWKFLNLSFLATPLGMVLALGVALLALWDDFQTFLEGGKSYINWGGEAARITVGLVTVFGSLAAVLVGIPRALMAVRLAWAAVNAVMYANPVGLIVAGVTALIALLTAADAKWRIFGGHLSGFFGSVGGKVLEFLSGGNVAANLTSQAQGAPQVAPIGANSSPVSNQHNQNVTQQTTVNVQGVPDAKSVGAAVSSATAKTNYDLVRNLSGSVRPGGMISQ
jgi:hypothetical protein